jgi:hypothetical protein
VIDAPRAELANVWCETAPRAQGQRAGDLHCGAYVGTAPRARGRHHLGVRHDLDPGNSLACAGTTAVNRPQRPRLSEQPRVRGDDRFAGSTAPPVVGTAPRARGRPQHSLLDGVFVGNSSACAGTTLLDLAFYQSSQCSRFTFGSFSLFPVGWWAVPCPVGDHDRWRYGCSATKASCHLSTARENCHGVRMFVFVEEPARG